jgi:hypothetical protein
MRVFGEWPITRIPPGATTGFASWRVTAMGSGMKAARPLTFFCPRISISNRTPCCLRTGSPPILGL